MDALLVEFVNPKILLSHLLQIRAENKGSRSQVLPLYLRLRERS